MDEARFEAGLRQRKTVVGEEFVEEACVESFRIARRVLADGPDEKAESA